MQNRNGVAVAGFLLLSLLSPMLISFASNFQDDSKSISNNLQVENSTSSLFSNVEGDNDECGLSTYSPHVQTAFRREAANAQDEPQIGESTAKWLVVLSEVGCQSRSEVMPYAKQLGAHSLESTILSGTWIMSFESGTEANSILSKAAGANNPSDEYFSSSTANDDLPFVETFHPMRETTRTPRLIPSDTKFSDQWHLKNTGQGGGTSGEDVNITGAWDNYDGSGVMIAIVDDGLDTTHDDLSPNYKSSLDYDYCANDANPDPSSWNGHGTSAAGVAAAYGNDNYGVTGASMNADLIGILLIACSMNDNMESNGLLHQKGAVDIYSNSWGPSDNGNTKEAPGPLMLAAFEEQAYGGRNGLGGIITFAGGNGGSNSDDSNYDGYANSRFTLAIGAVDDGGDRSYYSEPGANLIVVAPSDGGASGITTTDIEGSGGYSNGDWTNSFGGTSSATPLVSGIIGLIYDADPNLTWRDVQHILVNSAHKVDAGNSGWTTNGAGHEINHEYGHGMIDAGAATNLAANWTNVRAEDNWTSGQINVGTTIPDNSASWTTEYLNVSAGIKVETVEVLFDADHNYRGDLELTLVSPDGTESKLIEKHGDSGNNWNEWLFTSTLHWDEMSDGEWQLKVRDMGNGDTGTWNHWALSIHGTTITTDSDGDGLWDSNETDTWHTDPFDIDSDDDGLSDWDEVMVWNTDPNVNDSDLDGLDDGVEVNTHGTNPLDYDSDDDGLTDGDEVNIHNTNPTVYDPDADTDGFYWFQDCNDSNALIKPGAFELLNGYDDNCNEVIDEGYNMSDYDTDGLSDYAEWHTHLTNYQDNDTDADGLEDGEEVNVLGTDPLVYDPDTDTDSFYWFEDCNDTDASIYPNATEILDGIDQNCNDIIDETFLTSDYDEDGLTDYLEYHNYTTNWTNPDTDGDGIPDGAEVNVYMSDPLVFDPDEDLDNWYHFADCNDTNAEVFPGAEEIWNGIDDDCDDEVDEGTSPPTEIGFASLLTSVSSSGQVEQGGMVNYSAQAIDANDTINWTIEGSPYNGENVSHTYLEIGNFSWTACVSRENVSTCQEGIISVIEVIDTGNGDNTNGGGGNGSNSGNGSTGGSATNLEPDGLFQISTTYIAIFALSVLLIALIGLLLGRNNGDRRKAGQRGQPQGKYANNQFASIPPAYGQQQANYPTHNVVESEYSPQGKYVTQGDNGYSNVPSAPDFSQGRKR